MLLENQEAPVSSLKPSSFEQSGVQVHSTPKVRNKKIVRGGIHETIGLAAARHRLGYHRVHVKSTDE